MTAPGQAPSDGGTHLARVQKADHMRAHMISVAHPASPYRTGGDRAAGVQPAARCALVRPSAPALPGEEGAEVGTVGDRGEFVPGQDAQDVGTRAVAGLPAARVGDDQGVAVRPGPEDLLPAGGGAEPVLVEDGLAGAGGVSGDLAVAAGRVAPSRVEGGRGDDPGAVRGEERVAGRVCAAPGPVWIGHDD